MTTKEYRKQLADSFLHVLEEKQLDWKKEWQGISQLPVNGYSGYRYRGINRFFLMLVAMGRKYNDPRWCTYNQIASKKWKLKNAKGQGVKVEYWFPYDTQEKKSLTWQEFRDKEGDFSGSRYMLRAVYKTVFNASLIEGIQELPRFVNEEIKPDTLVNTLSQNMNVEITNDGGDRAYYSTAEDKIHMPLPETFHSQYGYDSSALHELAHSTGAEHRLNRPLQNTFGTEAYAYEELIAEISSCFFSANISIIQDENHIENHKAYVQSWITAIKEKPETLIRAVQQAEKVTAYMEYKAELIEKAEYEQVVSSTTEEKVTERGETAVEEKEAAGTGAFATLEDDLRQIAREMNSRLAEAEGTYRTDGYTQSKGEMHSLWEEQARLAMDMGIRLDAVSLYDEYHGSHSSEYETFPLTPENIENFFAYARSNPIGGGRENPFSGYERQAYISADYVHAKIPTAAAMRVLDRIREQEIVRRREAQVQVQTASMSSYQTAVDYTEQGLLQIEGRIQKVEKIINYIDEKLETKEQKTGIKKDYDVVPKFGTKPSIPIKL